MEPYNRLLTVTSYLTLLPTSLSDRMALSPFTSPEKKSCWGVAALVVGVRRGRAEEVQPNASRRVKRDKAEPKQGPTKQHLP